MSHGLADLVATAMDEGSCFHDRQRLPASCGAESALERRPHDPPCNANVEKDIIQKCEEVDPG